MLIILLGCAILLVPLQHGNAATISVNTFNDIVAVDGACSLREAITAVNNSVASGNVTGECAAGDSNNDTIVLNLGTYHLTITGANEDLNAQGDLDVRANVTIIGAGMESTTIDALGLAIGGVPDRVLHVVGPSIQVVLQDLTISAGQAPTATSNAVQGAAGGGIRVENANLTLQRVGLFGNVAGHGGDAPAGSNTNVVGGNGGGGGGLYATASSVTISDSVLTFNHGGTGGGYSNVAIGSPGNAGPGGAIWVSNNSALTLQRDILSANSAGFSGTYDGAAPLPHSSGSGDALYIDGSSTALVTQCNIDGNGTNPGGVAGGGVAVLGGSTLTLTQSSVTRNVSHAGGGIYAESAALVQLSNDTFAANTAGASGAIFLNNTAANIDFATISTNSGGINVSGAQPVQIRNSIVSGNAGSADCHGPMTSGGYNISGGLCPNNGITDVATTDPQLGPLTANGGMGDTMMPGPTSPATDAGNCAASSLNVDQRNHARPVDVPHVLNVADGCDIGAIELDDDLFWDSFGT